MPSDGADFDVEYNTIALDSYEELDEKDFKSDMEETLGQNAYVQFVHRDNNVGPPEKPVAPEAKPEEKPEETPVQQSMLPSDALYDTVKSAVIDAINEALAGNMKNLRGMIYTAIYTAVNAAKKEA